MIILDEATSALDSTTEAEISNEILKLKGRVTLIVVAHRLSTVINADRVVYFEDGEIKGIGTFQELRDQVPNFDENAKIAGYYIYLLTLRFNRSKFLVMKYLLRLCSFHPELIKLGTMKSFAPDSQAFKLR